MFDTFKNRLKITGTVTTITALRIAAGNSTDPIGSDLPVIKDVLGRPFIPGSSFKGAMRSRLESFLRGINVDLAANPAIESEWAVPYQNVVDTQGNIIKIGLAHLKEEADKRFKNFSGKESQKDQWLTAQLLQKTDIASMLFGSPWIASKFQVRDLTVLPDVWFGQYQERDGVAIDRDTETASDGKLYDFQVVPAGTLFELKAIVENAEDWELGLLMIGLHQFETEQIPLGGGRSRGLGVVCLQDLDMTWFDARTEENPNQTDPQKVINYLKKNVGLDVEEPVYVDVSQEMRSQWVLRLIRYLEQNITSRVQDVTTPSSSEEQ